MRRREVEEVVEANRAQLLALHTLLQHHTLAMAGFSAVVCLSFAVYHG